MTETPPVLTPETVDELLSAELDGEFDAAARDLGFAQEDARSMLAAYPGVDLRRDALARARDAFAVLPEIDELMEQRLRSKATRAGGQAAEEAQRRRRAHRWQRTLVAAGAVAAAAALVVGIVAVSSHNGESSKNLTASGATAATPAPATHRAETTAVDLGSVADVDALAARVRETERLDRLKSAPTKSASNQPGNPAAPSSSTYGTNTVELAPTATRGSASDTPGGTGASTKDCDVAARGFAAVTTAPILRATALLAGTRVTVEVFTKDPRTEILVVLTADCRLLNVRTLPAA